MSLCEICDKIVPDNEARTWLICHTCRRGLGMSWKKLSLYCLDSEELKAWRRMTTIWWMRNMDGPAQRISYERKNKREPKDCPPHTAYEDDEKQE
jgi:hypothetical protein